MDNKTAVKIVKEYLNNNITGIEKITTYNASDQEFKIVFHQAYQKQKISMLEITLEAQMNYSEENFVFLLNRHNIALRLMLNRYVKITAQKIFIHPIYQHDLPIEQFEKSIRINLNKPKKNQPTNQPLNQN